MRLPDFFSTFKKIKNFYSFFGFSSFSNLFMREKLFVFFFAAYLLKIESRNSSWALEGKSKMASMYNFQRSSIDSIFMFLNYSWRCGHF
jgi:hypothetical protein